MAQTQGNKVTEVVDGVVEQVDVSKHPTASIEASDLSLADIERRKSHPGHWALFIALVLVALIAPYWWGRVIAVKDAAWMVANLSFLDPKGVALISWTVTIMAMAGLGLMVADVKKWLWGTVFVVGLAAEQFVAELQLLERHLRDVRRFLRAGQRGEPWHYRSRMRCRLLCGALGRIAGMHQKGIEIQCADAQLGIVPAVLRD